MPPPTHNKQMKMIINTSNILGIESTTKCINQINQLNRLSTLKMHHLTEYPKTLDKIIKKNIKFKTTV